MISNLNYPRELLKWNYLMVLLNGIILYDFNDLKLELLIGIMKLELLVGIMKLKLWNWNYSIGWKLELWNWNYLKLIIGEGIISL